MISVNLRYVLHVGILIRIKRDVYQFIVYCCNQPHRSLNVTHASEDTPI